MSGARPIVLAGPTASGKSALALALAERLGGELLCADSRQVYRGLAVASAGPSDAERARVPHHGYGDRDPLDPMNAGHFIKETDSTIAAVQARGRLPIVVGGTGLYLRAWRLGLDDGRDMAAMLRRSPRVDARWLLLTAPLELLEPRIQARAAHMFEHGLLAEAKALQSLLPADHVLLQTLGIAEALQVAAGAMPLAAAVARTAQRTRQYARRQRTWFKKEPWWTPLPADAPTLVADALSLLGETH